MERPKLTRPTKMRKRMRKRSRNLSRKLARHPRLRVRARARPSPKLKILMAMSRWKTTRPVMKVRVPVKTVQTLLLTRKVGSYPF